MAPDERRIVAIAEMIERYVRKHPRAIDTAEGIGRWWLTSQHSQDSIELVQNAIDSLVEDGCLTRIQLVDGTVVYAAPEARREE